MSVFDKSVEYFSDLDYSLKIYEVCIFSNISAYRTKTKFQIHIEDMIRIRLDDTLTLKITLTSEEQLIVRCGGEGILAWYRMMRVSHGGDELNKNLIFAGVQRGVQG